MTNLDLITQAVILPIILAIVVSVLFAVLINLCNKIVGMLHNLDKGIADVYLSLKEEIRQTGRSKMSKNKTSLPKYKKDPKKCTCSTGKSCKTKPKVKGNK